MRRSGHQQARQCSALRTPHKEESDSNMLNQYNRNQLTEHKSTEHEPTSYSDNIFSREDQTVIDGLQYIPKQHK